MTVADVPADRSEKRAALSSGIVWDNHGCMPLRPDDTAFLPQLARYRAAGVNVVMLNVGYGEQSIAEHVRMLAAFRYWLAQRAEYRIIASIEDIGTAHACGQLAVGFDIEGATALGGQLSLIRLYYELGVRWMLMAYNRNNAAGGGCHDDDKGLTPFGKSALEEMARVGMVACCSHAGPRTALDVLEYSPTPPIFSHSNPRALREHPRNISDDLIKRCAARGGVVGINGIGIFLGANDNRSETFAAHIDYVAQLVGAQHVGIGLDYVFDRDEMDTGLEQARGVFPVEFGYQPGIRMVEPEQLAEIAESLRCRGYRDQDIAQVFGENFFRVAKQVWKPSL